MGSEIESSGKDQVDVLSSLICKDFYKSFEIDSSGNVNILSSLIC